MKRLAVVLCCVVGCTTTVWKTAAPGDIHEGSEVLFVGSERAVQIRNAHPSGDRVQGEVVHMWRLPPGPMRVPMSTGDEPVDIARRGGWQEERNVPAVFVGDAAEIDRVRGTQDMHVGRFVLEVLVGCAVIAIAFAHGFDKGGIGAQ